MTQNETTETTTVKKSKHPILKKILIGFVIVYILMYAYSRSTISTIQNNAKKLFVSTNNSLINQGVSIDHVVTSVYGDSNNIFDLTINNPTGFNSKFVFYSPEIKINIAYSSDPKIPLIAITSIIIKKSVINYEVNAHKATNLHKTLDNLILKLSPGPSFSPLSILTSAKQASTPLNYNGTKFLLGDVIFEKPTINIHNNGSLIKTYTSDNIVLKFNDVKQPLHYGDALLAGSLQLVDKLDKITKQ